ncbi:CHASE2 domain-containing protein [Chromobacterium sp. IIBBL 290-4]|uniref:CHASE2 domain-containing protein n=1 Tax=Chromobacterium sp. IIBBL 290-4 TaxID=2953890 RepID=UPI0020B84A33|nr:CHASE2 domain-containing protein [Chromobacterium sp. IIBBL 290-4]UTH74407.1 CHASE2 domain-containing protein [Chromobacterium sp. IIBBL 290-4]
MIPPHLRPLAKLTPALLAAAGLLLTLSQPQTRLDAWLYDGLTRLRPAPAGDAGITLIAIDQKSLAELGRWPWPRAYHALLLDKLRGARAVGMDIVMAEPSGEYDDLQLAQAIRGNGKVVSPVFPELQEGRLTETRPIPLLTQGLAALGHTDYEQDDDGVIRRVFLRAGLGAPRYPSFAQAVADTASRRAAPPLPQPDRPALTWQRSQPLMIPFSSGAKPYQTVSYADALLRLPPETFNQRIVLIGATATGLGQRHLTPVSAHNLGLSGVEINAYATYGLLTDQGITPLPPIWRALAAAVALLLGDWLLSRLSGSKRKLAGYALASLALPSGSAILLYGARIWIGGGIPASLLLLAGLGRFVAGHARLQQLASTDGLTGLNNRRQFDESYAKALQKHGKHAKPLALLIIDLDNFKGYNDRYGHAAGDEILRQAAGALTQCFTRRGELTARLGGEEFGVLLDDCGLETALMAADRFRRKLEGLALPHAASPSGFVTCSIGVAARVPRGHGDGRMLFEMADQALYQAKSEGRNRAVPAAG